MKARSSIVSLKELSFIIVLILLQIVIFSATADARSLRVFEHGSYERPDEMLSSELQETIFEPDVAETPMGLFSQVPVPQQLPPLSSPAPICAYPPSTLPSPATNPCSPPQVPSTIPSPTSYPSSPPPPPSPSTLPSPTSNPFSPPPPPPPPPPPSTLPSPTSKPPPYLPAQGPPPPFLPAQGPSPPPSLPTEGPPPTIPSPPLLQPSPPMSIPIPPSHNPTVPVMPYTPPPAGKKPGTGSWCVSKPTVSDAILQRGLDYACGMGADCKQIQPGGPCFQPNTVSAHSSFAFNSYWQKGKAAGGTCDFGGTAMIVTIDPSYDGCRFTAN